MVKRKLFFIMMVMMVPMCISILAISFWVRKQGWDMYYSIEKSIAHHELLAHISILENLKNEVDLGRLTRQEAEQIFINRLKQHRFLNGNSMMLLNDEVVGLYLGPGYELLVGQKLNDLADQEGLPFFENFVNHSNPKFFYEQTFYWGEKDGSPAELKIHGYSTKFLPWNLTLIASVYQKDVLVPASKLTKKILFVFFLGVVCALLTAASIIYRAYIVPLNRAHRIVVDQVQQNETMVSILCHDLSNPIQILSFLIYNFRQGRLVSPNDYELAFNRLADVTESMSELIGQVRRSQAWIKGKGNFSLQKIKALDVPPYCLKMCDEKLKEKNININFSVNIKNEEATFLADRVTFFHSVLLNILTNAIKFSYPGREIDFTIEELETEIMIKIQDYGIGMKKSTLDQLFSMSGEKSALGTNGEEGTGFGMPIVKRCMDLFQGRIVVKSTPAKGSELSGTSFSLYFKKEI